MINTSGFGVDVMPHYTPVDPSLVSLNPNNITTGVLANINVRQQAQQLAAQKAQEDYLSKIRPLQIQQEGARAQRATGTVAGQIGAENAQNSATAKVAPVQADTEVGKNVLAQGDIAYQQRIQKASQDADFIRQTAKNATADTDSKTIAQQALANYEIANDTYEKAKLETKNRPLDAQAKRDLMEAEKDHYYSASKLAEARAAYESEDRARLKEQDTAAKLKAAEDKIEASKQRNAGHFDAAKHAELDAQLTAVGKALSKTESEPLGFKSDKSPILLSEYESTTRDENGNKKKDQHGFTIPFLGYHIGGDPTPVALNPAAEAKIITRNKLRDRQARILDEMDQNGLASPANAPIANVVPNQQQVPQVIYGKRADGSFGPITK